MTREQIIFLQILSDHLHGRETAPAEGVDWAAVERIARDHQVARMVYVQCRDFLPEGVRTGLAEKNASELYYYGRVKLFDQVTQGLTEAGVPFFTVKGLNVAKLYPVPALRTMGDCDIVVHPEDKEKAHGAFEKLGFRVDGKEELEWGYWKNDLEFELHDHLLYDEVVNERNGLAFSKSAWEMTHRVEGQRYELDQSFHFVFLLLHLRKHIVGFGVGFRQFMDLAVVMRSCALDWPWIEATLDKLELRRFAETCFTLLERWFEVPPPFACRDMTDEFYEEATAKIFGNGVFGFKDHRNKENSTANAILFKPGPRIWIRIKSLIGSAFPPYRHMRHVPQYAFINGRPWLLPAAWIYRVYRAVRYGPERPAHDRQGAHLRRKAGRPQERVGKMGAVGVKRQQEAYCQGGEALPRLFCCCSQSLLNRSRV